MRTISIGAQGFDELRQKGYFYVDKTSFIKEWWESGDIVTLITRPRRFGKTLNMNMLNCFFSLTYAGRGELFDGLDIWEEERYRQIQGSYPVIFFSFANIKQPTFEKARDAVRLTISDMFQSFKDAWADDDIKIRERYRFMNLDAASSDVEIENSVHMLTDYLSFRYGKKVLIFLDEYDTPLQEAYVNGYWDEMSDFIRGFFNATFKTNPSMERAVLTGITRISKESIFSDLNNLKVITTTTGQYETAFGFTQEEVAAALEEYGLSAQKDLIRKWYDGFTFGKVQDIYNPWSILNYLDTGELGPYWANTSSNSLISYELRVSDNDIKQQMEILMNGGTVSSTIDEQIIYSQLEEKPEAIWSLFLAGGYLRVAGRKFDGKRYCYQLALTNLEVEIMFEDLITGWFDRAGSSNDEFVRCMIRGDVDGMNIYMNKITMMTFSSFDTGSRPSVSSPPERFYHGFVLGLLVRENDNYRIRSNRESGHGRYDICMVPRRKSLPGIVIEFKVQDTGRGEASLSEAADAALRQIRNRDYVAELKDEGVDEIREYGFAFCGKSVLIKKQSGHA